MEGKKQLGARIPPEVYKKLRVLAAQRDTTIAALVEEAILDLLRKYRKRGPTRG